MDKERLHYLIDVYKNNQATMEEREELDYWYASYLFNPNPTDELSPDEKERKRKKIWEDIINDHTVAPILSSKPHRRIRLVQSPIFWAAAVLIIIFGFAAYFYNGDQSNQPEVLSKFTLLENVKPGGNKATLVLSDGSIFDLSALNEGETIEQPGLNVTKTEDGLLTYISKPMANSLAPNYTINTPRGGQYQIILPDGTKVWLNAASSLTYPSQFSSMERRVELSGEAYFEVASHSLAKSKEKLPFIVKTINQEVEVLGTHFNIKAYKDDLQSKTTLLEGKVKVIGYANGIKSRQEKILGIGQEATWGNNQFEIIDVDTERAIAWKNGKFIFSGENIKNIMANISRWYNVEVAYKGDLSNINFEGAISRYETITEVLRKLELTGTVHFEIVPINNVLGQERRIIVMP